MPAAAVSANKLVANVTRTKSMTLKDMPLSLLDFSCRSTLICDATPQTRVVGFGSKCMIFGRFLRCSGGG